MHPPPSGVSAGRRESVLNVSLMYSNASAKAVAGGGAARGLVAGYGHATAGNLRAPSGARRRGPGPGGLRGGTGLSARVLLGHGEGAPGGSRGVDWWVGLGN